MRNPGLVHVIDDEEAVRKSLSFLLRTSGYRVQCWADGLSFLKASPRLDPGCVLLDIRMPHMDGLEVQAQMTERGIGFPVIVLTGHGDISLAVRAMRGGAVDFLEKPFDRTKLLAALDVAFREQVDAGARREQAALARARVAALTERERDVLEGLACGYPNKTIGYDLGISARTVEVHRANLMTKLGVSNFADALRIAFNAGMGDAAGWRLSHVQKQTAQKQTERRPEA